jgi:hypothetical protein
VIQRAGGFVGELNILTGQARYVSVLVREGGSGAGNRGRRVAP